MVPEPELNPPVPQQDPRPAEPPVAAEYPQSWPSMAPDASSVPPGYLAYPGYPVPGYAEPPVALAAARPEPLPAEPREYHQFYRAPAFRWWKPVVAVLLFAVLEVAFIVVLGVVWVVGTLASGNPLPQEVVDFDPASLFIVNNVGVAAGLPIAFLVHRIVFRQRPRWLSSVVGGFRWGPFWRFLAIAGVGLLASTVAQALLTGGFGELTWNGSSLVLIATIVLTTPFQCAAEEYSVRGLLFRGVGSWFANPRVGLAVGMVVSSVAFMLLHGAGDPWLNAFYLIVGGLFATLVWRSGGLEAAVAMHIANNVISEMLLPFQPDQLSTIFNRQAGVGDPSILIQMGAVLLVGGLLLWQSSRLGMVRTAAPAAATQV